MKTFQCTSCGHQLQRPTQPYKCPQCGRQAIGLFRVVQGAAQPAPPQGAHPSYPSQSPPQPTQSPPQAAQGGFPPAQGYQAPAQPQQLGPAPTQHGGVTPLAPPPPPPGTPQPPAQYQPPQPTPYQPAPQPPAPQPPAQHQPVPRQPVARQPAQPPAQPPGPPPIEKARPAPPPLPPSGKAGAKPTKPKSGGPQRRPSSGRPPRTAPPPTQRPAAPAPAPAPKPEPPKPRPKIRPKPLRPEPFVWAYPAEPPYEDEARAMRNAPAVDPQDRTVLCHQGRLLALVEENGRPRVVWEYVIGSPVPGPVVVSADGTIRAHCADGYLHCLNSAGKQEWSPAQVGEPLGCAAPVVDAEGNTYASAYDGGLVRVDRDGRPDKRLYFRSRAKLDSAGIIHQGTLYVGSEDGYVFAVELADRRGRNLWDHAAERGYTGWFVNSSPAVVPDGTLVVAARDEHLYGFDPAGQQAWCTKTPGQMLGSPVIDPQGHVYVGAFQSHRGQQGRGFLVSVDGNSHKVRWRYEAAGPVESTPVIGDDGVIYFGDNAGTIHAVDPVGKALWTARVECAVRSAGTILAPQRVAFGLDDDTLVVLRCSSGGLAPGGWPKIRRDLGQTGFA